MKTLEQLMKNTPTDVVERSRQTNAEVIKPPQIVNKRGVKTVVFVVRCKAVTEKYFYDVIIELYPTEISKGVFLRPSLKSPAWVQCSCPFYLFNCEWTLAKAGSSEIKYSNGQPPRTTNPDQIPYLCKHLYKASPAVVKEAIKAGTKDERFDFV